MNRSSKGFGLVGVVATVLVLIIVAMFSATARSNTLLLNDASHLVNIPTQIVVSEE